MSRTLSKQCAVLNQLTHLPGQWSKLDKHSFKSVLTKFPSLSQQRWTSGFTGHHNSFSNLLDISSGISSVQKEFEHFSSTFNSSSISASHSTQATSCLGYRSSELRINDKSSKRFLSISRFYHSGQSPQERHTSPNVRLKSSSNEVRKEDQLTGNHTEHLDATRSLDSSLANKTGNDNTDFGVQLTLAQKLVESCPATVQPYLQLMRIDRPIGTWLLFWPCGWGLALAAGAGHWPDPWLLAVFGCGALVMRGAGCTINDLWDRDIDSKVIRTKDRPLASGAVEPLDAVVFLGAQLGIGLLVLLQLNWHSILLGAASLGLVCTYPLVKRVSHWPQLVLGLTFNWGVLLGWCAVHGSVSPLPVLPLYAAGVFWTLIYDTIYAHQDKLDDLSIGIKSTALMFGDSTRAWLGVFGVGMVGSLLLAGHASGLAWPHYLATAATAANIVHQLRHLDIHNRAQCGQQFRHNRHVGLLVFLGLVGGSLLAHTHESPERSEPALWAAPTAPGNQLHLQE